MSRNKIRRCQITNPVIIDLRKNMEAGVQSVTYPIFSKKKIDFLKTDPKHSKWILNDLLACFWVFWGVFGCFQMFLGVFVVFLGVFR